MPQLTSQVAVYVNVSADSEILPEIYLTYYNEESVIDMRRSLCYLQYNVNDNAFTLFWSPDMSWQCAWKIAGPWSQIFPSVTCQSIFYKKGLIIMTEMGYW